MRQPEPQDVYLAVLGMGGKFTAPDHLDAQVTSGFLGLVQAGDGVMVGNGHSGQTSGMGLLHQG